jgi:hypothetical protein
LDTFFNEQGLNPDIIKVDVQGFELYVFQGMKKYLSDNLNKPKIIFEFEDWAEAIALGKENISKAQKYLKNKGYHIYSFDKRNYPILNDVICSGSHELIAQSEIQFKYPCLIELYMF